MFNDFMSVCLECGEPACGEETYTTEKGSTTCYFCQAHLNRVNLDGNLIRKLNNYSK
jgi:hypothetical protein